VIELVSTKAVVNFRTARIMKRSEIEAELQNYVQSAAMPCPYARLPTSYLHLDEGVETKRTRETLQKALGEFWPDERIRILAIVPRHQPPNHFEARKQAYWLRYHWHYLHLEQQGRIEGEGRGVDSRLKELYSDWMSDTYSFVGPRVLIGNADIMMTALNPLYDAEHPRYAPHTVFPVIRSKDLLAIHENHPDVSFQISAHAKCKMVLSMLSNRHGIEIAEMRGEYDEWLDALSYYRDFVTTIYTDSYRIDPRTLPRLSENRRRIRESMESEHFQASLVAFRIIVSENPKVPSLRRILAQNPDMTVFDIARVVYGDVAGMYVIP
jgi:hypothetical protein